MTSLSVKIRDCDWLKFPNAKLISDCNVYEWTTNNNTVNVWVWFSYCEYMNGKGLNTSGNIIAVFFKPSCTFIPNFIKGDLHTLRHTNRINHWENYEKLTTYVEWTSSND